ncbi:hypothetical protein ACOMHN_003145 [Nucella lapillus]
MADTPPLIPIDSVHWPDFTFTSRPFYQFQPAAALEARAVQSEGASATLPDSCAQPMSGRAGAKVRARRVPYPYPSLPSPDRGHLELSKREKKIDRKLPKIAYSNYLCAGDEQIRCQTCCKAHLSLAYSGFGE